MMAKIDEDKCVGCGICVNTCQKGIEMGTDKARIIDEDAECLRRAADVCPRNAIILGDENEQDGKIREIKRTGFNQDSGQGRGFGRGMGRGLGRGPHDGRGMGRGGGGRGR